MKGFFDWYRSCGLDAARPWLIFGKGPSFSKRSSHDLTRFHTLSLNHAVREQAVTLAHMIDFDVVEACGEDLYRNARFLVMPWMPHIQCKPSERTLEDLLVQSEMLRRFDREGRLLWYNLSSAPRRRDDSPVVRVAYFSAEAAINLLVTAGVRTVRSLGVDGGASYSPEFSDLRDKTLLANGWQDFDRQFAQIARTIRETGIDYAPLDLDAPIRVFVGMTESEELPYRVLEYSIRKHTSMTVEVRRLLGHEIPMPKRPECRPRTPFSFQRLLIPELVGRQGRALYLDSDMQVFRDLRMLWKTPMNGCDVVVTPQSPERRFSVMLLDCGRLSWDLPAIVRDLDEGRLTYRELMWEMKIAGRIGQHLDPSWNRLDEYVEGSTGLVHYTHMPSQPWVATGHPHAGIWLSSLREAVCDGSIPRSLVMEEIRRGHVRPSLMTDLDGSPDVDSGRGDEEYVPPYRRLVSVS